MAFQLRSHAHSAIPSDSGQVGTSERWLSAAAGLGLAWQALRARDGLNRLLLGVAGASLLTRSAAGYCAIKSSLAGDTSFTQGLKEQARRLSHVVGRTSAERLDTMSELFRCELQELYSAETQLANALERAAASLQNESLSQRIDEYVAELRARRADLEALLTREGIDPGAHPDDAMHALLIEMGKMARLRVPSVREAALIASLQRIIHYKIAGYGTIAAYAKVLGKIDQAGRLAEWAARDRTIDQSLTDLAKSTLNPQAVRSPERVLAPGSMRTH